MSSFNKKKKYYFIFSIVCIIWLVLIYFYNIDFNYIDKEQVISSHTPQKNLLTNIRINGSLGSYDKNNDSFYFSMDSLNYKKIEIISSYDLKYFINKIDDKHYCIFVYTSYEYYQYDIYLVSIPLVNIYTFDVFDTDKCDMMINECPIGVTISDYSSKSHDILNTTGKLRVRGVTSRQFEKKSYKLSVDKKNQILGLNYDNDWVLDALYSDPSKIRNKLSSDIWNEINNNQSIDNDLNSQFVEVFIDNEYKGLYTLKNNVDKHVTFLDDNGLLIKSIDHFNYDYLDIIKNREFFINDDGSFLNMEIKNYNPYLFQIFLDKLYNYYVYKDALKIFNENNYLNYKVFISLLSGDDNVTKNLYYSIRNSDDSILITPWDLDMTWGLEFDLNSNIFSSKDNDSYNDDSVMQKDVMYDLTDESFEKVKDHYWKLRNEKINIEMIDYYLDSYKKILVESGASMRDSSKWYSYDIEQEIEDIREWAMNRINYLDNYFM